MWFKEFFIPQILKIIFSYLWRELFIPPDMKFIPRTRYFHRSGPSHRSRLEWIHLIISNVFSRRLVMYWPSCDVWHHFTIWSIDYVCRFRVKCPDFGVVDQLWSDPGFLHPNLQFHRYTYNFVLWMTTHVAFYQPSTLFSRFGSSHQCTDRRLPWT